MYAKTIQFLENMNLLFLFPIQTAEKRPSFREIQQVLEVLTEDYADSWKMKILAGGGVYLIEFYFKRTSILGSPEVFEWSKITIDDNSTEQTIGIVKTCLELLKMSSLS